MPYSREFGYEVRTIAQIMDELRQGVNEEFDTEYDENTFQGTGFYRYNYFAAQQIQKIEIKASEVFTKAADYIVQTNQRILKLASSSNGFISRMELLGYMISVDKPTLLNKGILRICVDLSGYSKARLELQSLIFTAKTVGADGNEISVEYTSGATAGAEVVTVTDEKISVQIEDGVSTATQVLNAIEASVEAMALVSVSLVEGEGSTAQDVAAEESLEGGSGDVAAYEDLKTEINTAIKENTIAGMVYDGPEESSLAISNGQYFTFSYHLPLRKPTILKITLTRSPSSNEANPTDDIIRIALFQKISQLYRVGRDFEPERYIDGSWYSWAKSIVLERSHNDGGTWETGIFTANFDDVLSINLNDIQVEVI